MSSIRHDYIDSTSFVERLNRLARWKRRLQLQWFCVGAISALFFVLFLTKWVEAGGQ